MKQALILLGASGHAQVVVDLVEKSGNHELIGILDANRPEGSDFVGYPILGRDEWLERETAACEITQLLPAIGDNWTRSQACERFMAALPEVSFASVVHPSAHIGRDVEIGPGTVIMAGAIVNAGARIGKGCVVNSGAILEHGSVMEDYSSLGPGAVVGGNCRIGTLSFIGLGARISHGIHIGEHAVIGTGSTVVKDLPEKIVAYGSPAEVVRARFENEAYL